MFQLLPQSMEFKSVCMHPLSMSTISELINLNNVSTLYLLPVWDTPFEIHTPPVEDLGISFMAEYDF